MTNLEKIELRRMIREELEAVLTQKSDDEMMTSEDFADFMGYSSCDYARQVMKGLNPIKVGKRLMVSRSNARTFRDNGGRTC